MHNSAKFVVLSTTATPVKSQPQDKTLKHFFQSSVSHPLSAQGKQR